MVCPMKHERWLAAAALVATLGSVVPAQYKPEFNTTGPGAKAGAEGDPKGGEGESGPYDVDPNWPKPLPNHEGWTWGRTAGVWAESADRIFVFQSGELPWIHPDKRIGRDGIPTRAAAYAAKDNRKEHVLMIFDRQGNLIDSWERHNAMFDGPHSVKMNPYDKEKHIWVIDNGAQQIHKFTNDGTLVMTLGERGKRGTDQTHFGGPADIAFLPNGDFFIADGYQNSRVVKFNKDGKYLLEWGKWGPGPGEFNQLHSVAVDAKQRVYVADRVNSRIQVFDANGKFLDQWPNIRFPLHIGISRDQHLWVADMLTSKILKYDLNGKLLYSWGTFGGQPGQIWGVHGFSVDNEGNFYVAEVYNGRAQKFIPRKGVEAWKLIGPLGGA